MISSSIWKQRKQLYFQAPCEKYELRRILHARRLNSDHSIGKQLPLQLYTKVLLFLQSEQSKTKSQKPTFFKGRWHCVTWDPIGSTSQRKILLKKLCPNDYFKKFSRDRQIQGKGDYYVVVTEQTLTQHTDLL